MIVFKQVTRDDYELNSRIEELNEKVFPSTENTEDLHFLTGCYKGASVILLPWRMMVHLLAILI